VAAAAAGTAFTVCIHAGQGCALTTRLVVPREKYDEAVQSAADTMAAIGTADPADPSAICGPVISKVQRDRVEAYLRLAEEEGGTFATGGRVQVKEGDLAGGFWVEPTVIAGLDNSSRLAQEEIFGPVLVVIPHDGDDDAVPPARSPVATSSAPRRSRTASAPAPSPSTAACGSAPTHPSAATSSPAWAGRWVSPASRSTSRRRPSPSPPETAWA
jgi:aldehyde dehydrogenase (NAD+)